MKPILQICRGVYTIYCIFIYVYIGVNMQIRLYNNRSCQSQTIVLGHNETSLVLGFGVSWFWGYWLVGEGFHNSNRLSVTVNKSISKTVEKTYTFTFTHVRNYGLLWWNAEKNNIQPSSLTAQTKEGWTRKKVWSFMSFWVSGFSSLFVFFPHRPRHKDFQELSSRLEDWLWLRLHAPFKNPQPNHALQCSLEKKQDL